MVELVRQNKLDPTEVIAIEANVTHMTYDFAGGGLYGVNKVIRTKEQADHNHLASPGHGRKRPLLAQCVQPISAPVDIHSA
jgi:hypothetical protein